MLKTVHYGTHTFAPWCGGSGFVDKDAKSLKSYRSREPRTIWQSLQAKTDDLGDYDLHFCPHCLLYSSLGADISKHKPLCRYRNGTPGRKVYEDDEFEVREVYTEAAAASITQCAPQGAPTQPSDPKNDQPQQFDSVKLYLQCLSLFGHLFLDTKSICFSVDAFLFYIAIEKESGLVCGFFSKEIDSWHDYNLACIVIFPPWQMRGLGQRLIALSYMLSQYGKKTGSPEKPLSKHGQLAYNAYWMRAIAQYCVSERSAKKLTLRDISKGTGIDPTDLATLLKEKGALNGPKAKKLKLSKIMKKGP